LRSAARRTSPHNDRIKDHSMKSVLSAWNRAGIGTKLVTVVLVAVTAALGTLAWVISGSAREIMDRKALETLRIELRMTVDMLSSYDERLVKEVESLTSVLASEYPAHLDLDAGSRMTVGTRSVPTFTNNGRPYVIDESNVDAFLRKTGAIATVFVLDGDEFVRVTTSLRDAKGARAVGTVLAKDSPAMASLKQGMPFSGKVRLMDREFMTRYVPLRSSAGKVVGALFVGLDFSRELGELKARIKQIKVGDTGYIYALDATPGKNLGEAVIHPAKEGKSLLAAKDASGHEFIREIVEKREGLIRYPWLNPELGDKSPREKIVVYGHFKGWNWVVGVGSYSDEFSGAANTLRNQVLIAALVAAGLLGVVVWFMVRGVVVRPLAVAAKAADDVARGDVGGDIPQGRADEIGALLGAMRGMQSMLRRVSEAQEEMSRHHAAGEIGFRIPAVEFPGAFGRMATQTNDLVHAHIDVSNRIVDAAGAYARGDFSVKMDVLPGEQARFTQAVEAVRTSLASAAEAATINARIRNALDNAGTAACIADVDGRIVYVNHAMEKTLRLLAPAMTQRDAGFRPDAIVGSSIGVLHEDPRTALAQLASLSGTSTSRVVIGERTFEVGTTPVTAADGSRLGSVSEWRDRTDELVAQEREREVASENLRVRHALDNVSSNVMVADADGQILYMNKAVLGMMRNAESDLRKALPGFDANRLIGANFDTFHRNPGHQRNLLANLRSAYATQIEVAGRTFRLEANPIVDEGGVRVGTVVEWRDRTAEVAAEAEVGGLVSAAAEGDFTKRISESGKEGFFLQLATGMNKLMDTSSVGLEEVARVFSALAKGRSDGDDRQRVQRDVRAVEGRREHDGGTAHGDHRPDQGSDGTDRHGGERDRGRELGPVAAHGRTGLEPGRDGELDGRADLDGEAERGEREAGEPAGAGGVGRGPARWGRGQAGGEHHERDHGELEEDLRHHLGDRRDRVPDQHPGAQRGGGSGAGGGTGTRVRGGGDRSEESGAEECGGGEGDQVADLGLGREGGDGGEAGGPGGRDDGRHRDVGAPGDGHHGGDHVGVDRAEQRDRAGEPGDHADGRGDAAERGAGGRGGGGGGEPGRAGGGAGRGGVAVQAGRAGAAGAQPADGAHRTHRTRGAARTEPCDERVADAGAGRRARRRRRGPRPAAARAWSAAAMPNRSGKSSDRLCRPVDAAGRSCRRPARSALP
jgi:PAS domain-containing protein